MKNKKILIIDIIAIVIVVASIIVGAIFFICEQEGNYQKSIHEDDSKIISKANARGNIEISIKTNDDIKIKYINN